MEINQIPDELWNDLPQIETKNEQIRLRIRQDNIEFIKEMEKEGVDRHFLANLALSILRPKLSCGNFSKENIINYFKN
jgi:hypothetical protein